MAIAELDNRPEDPHLFDQRSLAYFSITFGNTIKISDISWIRTSSILFCCKINCCMVGFIGVDGGLAAANKLDVSDIDALESFFWKNCLYFLIVFIEDNFLANFQFFDNVGNVVCKILSILKFVKYWRRWWLSHSTRISFYRAKFSNLRTGKSRMRLENRVDVDHFKAQFV